MTEMTPEDLAAMDIVFCPHIDWQTNHCARCQRYRLAEALEQSWRDRDIEKRHYAEAWAQECALVNEMRERAERAEAEIRALLKSEDNEILGLRDQLDDAETALARVRALCERLRYGSNEEASVARELREAIEGDPQ